uniref:Uncharacterized protein n=1 Tax=Megaselia scalaris TaxID=36166 RepID=T1GEV5_MEGSC
MEIDRKEDLEPDGVTSYHVMLEQLASPTAKNREVWKVAIDQAESNLRFVIAGYNLIGEWESPLSSVLMIVLFYKPNH